MGQNNTFSSADAMVTHAYYAGGLKWECITLFVGSSLEFRKEMRKNYLEEKAKCSLKVLYHAVIPSQIVHKNVRINTKNVMLATEKMFLWKEKC